MRFNEIASLVNEVASKKPYKMVFQNGMNVYHLVFYYGEYHYDKPIAISNCTDRESVIEMIKRECKTFEQNMKLKIF